ncbi:class I tRNA ligase family protein [Streptomyces sp. NPDC006197]|uniref:class I tRNA ligase family protein n=1 Tax=Streptomyces sp. NPDC006197 TaxID=3156685 RepID=UPI0033B7CD79
MSADASTHWITATPPTPNGDLHIGHLAGPYLAGDVLRRFLAAEGAGPVRYTTGLDDHQSYVPVRGLNDGGRKGEEVADGYGASIESVWRQAGADFDAIVRPRRDVGYQSAVQEFFGRLHEAGHIVARTRPLPYCTGCERWLYEAYLKGDCPHCGSGSNGNACEPCGRPNDCADLANPVCTGCGATPELRDCERLYFPLAPWEEQLTAFWEQVDMPPHLRSLCERMRADGLPEIAVSHPSEWGVPVPVEGFTEQRIYVWFEMAPGYLLEWTGAGGTGPAPAPVQFFGFDNGYFHALLFPAAFRAYDPEIALPKAFVVNEFYRLEGLKFSTSRRHAIWAHEELARTSADVLRYHVLSDRPNGRQTSFSSSALELSRARLAERWDGWLGRLLTAVAESADGLAPAEAPRGPAWERLRARLTETVGQLREAYGAEIGGYDARRAIALLDEAVCLAEDFGHVNGFEAERPDGAAAHRSALSAQLAVAAALSAWAAPALPYGSARLTALLGLAPEPRRVDAEALAPLAPGTPVAAWPGAVFSA